MPNAEYTSWTITLRPTVVFHDGTPCDGAALLMNLEAQYHSLLTGLVLKPVVDDIHPDRPADGDGEPEAGLGPLPLLPGRRDRRAGGLPDGPGDDQRQDRQATDNPIGTGPFKFKEWVPNTHFTATAWPGYWRKGLPYLDSITFKPIIDYTSRAEALSPAPSTC